MIRNIALLFLLLLPTLAMAQLDSEFVFNGQNAEVLVAEKPVTIVTPETVEVPSTCSRQVPNGQREVCRNETRYRQECAWVPASTQCSNYQERVCRPVTRTRQECTTTPSRQVCTQQPSRQVCTDQPSRRVCTTRPDGSQHCTNVGGGRTCQTVGGGRTCQTVPGERQCRNVTYTDQSCDYVTRQRCDTIPGRNVCRDVAYSEPVCRMETQYRTEQYACTRTEVVNRTEHKVIKAETNVRIISNGLVDEFPVAVSIKEVGSKYDNFSIDVRLVSEPSVFVVLRKKDVKVASVNASEIAVKGEVVLEVLSREMLPLALPSEIVSATIDKKENKMVVIFEGPISAQGEIDFKITYKQFLSSTKTIAELKAAFPSEQVELGVVDGKVALSIDMKDAMKRGLEKKNMLLKFRLTSDLNLRGELLNQNRPENSKLYEGTFVQQR